MTDWLRYWFNTTRRAVELWLESHAISYAGALAFFTLFSIAPVVILAVKVASLVMSSDAAMAAIFDQISQTAGPAVADEVRTLVTRVRMNQTGFLPSVLSGIAIIIGATTVFGQLQKSLNTLWDVAPRPSRNTLLALIKNRLMSLTVVLSLGFVLLVSLLLSVAVSAVVEYGRHWVPVPGFLVVGLEQIVSLGVTGLLFAAMFQLLPDVLLGWRDVVLGAFITALLFAAGRALIAFYLSHTAPASSYGAAGSLVILLLWVYYSSMILLFGAAFTRAHCEARGRRVRVRRTAIKIKRQSLEDDN